jgi:hypothetical protein
MMAAESPKTQTLLRGSAVSRQYRLIRATVRLSPGDLRQYIDRVKILYVGDSTLP